MPNENALLHVYVAGDLDQRDETAELAEHAGSWARAQIQTFGPYLPNSEYMEW